MATINVSTQSATVVDSGSDKKVVLNETSNTTSGTNTFAIQDSAAAAKVLLRGSGDTVLVEGLSAEYQVKANGKTVTLKSADQTITIVLNSLTKTTPATAKIVFLDGELSVGNTAGSSVIKLGDQSLTKKFKDLSATPADSATASNYFDDSQGTPTGGASLKLTIDSDTLEGDAGNNTFKGRIGTVDGIETNTLNSGDSIDGRDGTDTLQAQVFTGGTVGNDNSFRPIQPEIANVEIIKLEAQYRDLDVSSGEDNIGDDVHIRAAEITDVDQLWSYNSTADLIVQDLTTLESNGNVRNTKDMTIGMAYTANSDHQWDESDYKVYFDQDYLIPRQLNQGSQLFIELMDMDSALTGGDPLADNPFGQIVFTIGGVQKTLTFGTNANTYAELLTDIQAAIAAKALTDPAFAKLTAGFGPAFTATDTDNLPGGSTNGTSIVITNSGSEPLAAVSMTATGTQPAGKDFHTGFSDKVPGTQDIPVEINIALEKVGDSGDGGNLVIGSMNKDGEDSNSIFGVPTYNDTVAGIEKFNVTVYGNAMKPSSVASLRSTNNTLETVVVTSEARTDNSYADLIIGNRHATFATWGYGLKDVASFNSTLFKADATISAVLTDEMAAKYGDGAINVAYAFGEGDDSLQLDINENSGQGLNVAVAMADGDDNADITIDGDTVDAVTESFSLNLGDGNNTARVGVVDGEDWFSNYDNNGVSLDTTAALQNLTITSGSGDDSVTVFGEGQFDIHVGAGSDFVMIDAGGSDAQAEVWAPSESGGGFTFDDIVLYQAKLSVRYAGFESTVAIDTGADFIATQREINVAIAKAIEANPELMRLISTEIGTTDQDLIVQSLIDGDNAAELIIYQPQVITSGTPTDGQVSLSNSHVNTLKASLIATGQATDSADVDTNPEIATLINNAAPMANTVSPDDNGMTNVTGDIVNMAGSAWHRVLFVDHSEGTVINNSTINMGTGSNDLVVLSSNDASSNTLEFDAAWGKVSVVNWFSDEDLLQDNNDNATAGLNGGHLLDFTAFLTNEYTTSGSTESEKPVNISIGTGATEINTNEIVFVNVDDLETAAGGSANYAFASLSASQVQSALNATGGFDWTTATVSDGTTAGLAVGTTTRTALVIVENLDDDYQEVIAGGDTNYANYGDYKVYQVTFGVTEAAGNNNGDAGFTVSYLGQIDFGNSLDLTTLAANIVGSGTPQIG